MEEKTNNYVGANGYFRLSCSSVQWLGFLSIRIPLNLGTLRLKSLVTV